MSKIFRVYMIILTALWIVPASAANEDNNEGMNNWVNQQIRLSYKGEGYSDHRKNSVERGEELFTSSATETGVYFRCLEGRLRVGLVFEPQNLRDAFRNNNITGVSGNGNFVPTSNNLRSVKVRFDDGKYIGLGRWIYYKKKSALMSRDRKSAAKIYNAIIKKQAIYAKTSGKPEVLLAVPKIDETFADFGSGCGIGRLQDK